MDPTVELHLQRLGFGEYEARAYLALLQHGPSTGYEVAKVSGVPRPNIYPVLQRLEERGAVVRAQTAGGARYAAVPPGRLLEGLRASHDANLDDARRALDAITPGAAPDFVWNAVGYRVLLERARELLGHAEQHVLLALWPQEAAEMALPLAQARTRGVEATVLCLEGCAHPCGGCGEQVYRLALARPPQRRWLVAVADGAELLAGEVHGPDALVSWTQQPMLVQLATWYIKHSIASSVLVQGLGPRLREMVDPLALETLEQMSLADEDGVRWLDKLASAVRHTS